MTEDKKANQEAPVGSVWVFYAKEQATITRPDGSEVKVNPEDKQVQHVLDLPGEYSADLGGKTETIKAS